jgi:hypothetical protein
VTTPDSCHRPVLERFHEEGESARRRTEVSSRGAEVLPHTQGQGPLRRRVRILPRASDLWVQASLDYKQRLQECFSRNELRSMEIDSIEPP